VRSYINLNKKLARRYDDWMVAMHYAPHTRQSYARTVRLFREFLGSRSIASVSHLEIRQFMKRVAEDGATWHTTYNHLGVLRQFYDFLNLGGVVSYVAPRLVRLRAPKKKLLPILSETEIQRLIAATETLRERALVEIFYGTGCRLREVSHLRMDDVDFATRTARVTGKFRKTRVVLLTKSAIQALRAYVGNRQSGFVFREDRPTPKGWLAMTNGYWVATWKVYHRRFRKGRQKSKCLGRVDAIPREVAKQQFDSLVEGVNLICPATDRPLSNTSVRMILRGIGERVGLRNVGPHMLRRSFATHLYDHGAGLEVIQALLGHVYLQTTMQYIRLSTSRLLKTFENSHPRGQMKWALMAALRENRRPSVRNRVV